MKKLFCLLIVSLFFSSSSEIFGQNGTPLASFVFPNNSSEFTITFPAKPKIETIYATGKSGGKAELLHVDSILRAEVIEITPAEAEQVLKNDDSYFVKIGFSYAESNGFSNSTATTGLSKLGRFVKIRGYKKISDIPATYEVIFYYGKKQAVVLLAGAMSSQYPTNSITAFFSSFKSVKSEPKEEEELNESLDETKKNEGWVEFGADDRNQYFYMPKKIIRKAYLAEGWVETRDKGDVIDKILFECNCKTKRIRTLAGVEYFTYMQFVDGSKKLKISPSSWDTPKAIFKRIIPDSLGETIFNRFCDKV